MIPALDVKEHFKKFWLTFLIAGMCSTLHQLIVGDRNHRDVAWISALKRHACNLVQLELDGIDNMFPLEGILRSCGTLQCLSLGFVGSAASTWRLENVAKCFPRLKELNLSGLNPKGGFKHIWMRFEYLKVLTIFSSPGTCARQFYVYGPKPEWLSCFGMSDFYDGIE